MNVVIVCDFLVTGCYREGDLERQKSGFCNEADEGCSGSTVHTQQCKLRKTEVGLMSQVLSQFIHTE